MPRVNDTKLVTDMLWKSYEVRHRTAGIVTEMDIVVHGRPCPSHGVHHRAVRSGHQGGLLRLCLPDGGHNRQAHQGDGQVGEEEEGRERDHWSRWEARWDGQGSAVPWWETCGHEEALEWRQQWGKTETRWPEGDPSFCMKNFVNLFSTFPEQRRLLECICWEVRPAADSGLKLPETDWRC